MNKRYIDFVPAKKGNTKAVVTQRTVSAVRTTRSTVVARPVTNSTQGSSATPTKVPTAKSAVVRTPAMRTSEAKANVPKAALSPRRRVARREIDEPVIVDGREVEFGVIEDLGPVQGTRTIAERPEQKPAKAQEKSQPKSETKTQGKTFNIPRTPFINQEKVVKRPLSKNVYAKRVTVPKEEPKGPITIITKPEKDAHVSLIVAVILTIILGAAAGTVAFLLLPK